MSKLDELRKKNAKNLQSQVNTNENGNSTLDLVNNLIKEDESIISEKEVKETPVEKETPAKEIKKEAVKQAKEKPKTAGKKETVHKEEKESAEYFQMTITILETSKMYLNIRVANAENGTLRGCINEIVLKYAGSTEDINDYNKLIEYNNKLKGKKEVMGFLLLKSLRKPLEEGAKARGMSISKYINYMILKEIESSK